MKIKPLLLHGVIQILVKCISMTGIKGNIAFIAKSRPWIDKNKMSPMLPISFEARDGLTVEGYLTVPKNSNGKNLPLIVNPHGGPNAREILGDIIQNTNF